LRIKVRVSVIYIASNVYMIRKKILQKFM
jgi:hypothetical protein